MSLTEKSSFSFFHQALNSLSITKYFFCFSQGHDTTAAGITWALYLLGRHPVIQQKVHDEVDSFFGEFSFFFSVSTDKRSPQS